VPFDQRASAIVWEKILKQPFFSPHRLISIACCRWFFALSLIAFAPAASAMDFEQVAWRGHTVLNATGPIVAGDAEKFAIALQGTPASSHGVPIVLLDSLGGSVFEAFKMSEFLDSSPAHMVIPNGAKCASACASILYIGGAFRTMEPFAAFGQHSCSISGVQNQSCNDTLAEHAVINGVSYGSVAAFVTYVPPEDILWFSRGDLDCWGVSRYPFTMESSFEKSEPCVFRVLGARMPAAQSAWRVDFHDDGYMAFLRPASDHLRELQLDLWCDELKPGKLFLSMEIQGPSEIVKQAVVDANLLADPVKLIDVPFTVEQVDELYSRATVEIQGPDVLPFLTQSKRLSFILHTRPPYETIQANTQLAGSRRALIFAANNCRNK
jgi:hypothetical protein